MCFRELTFIIVVVIIYEPNTFRASVEVLAEIPWVTMLHHRWAEVWRMPKFGQRIWRNVWLVSFLLLCGSFTTYKGP